MNLNVMTPIGYTGYGYVGLNILRSLYINNKNNIGLNIIGQPNVENQEDVELLRSYTQNLNTLPYDTPCLKIWHQFDLLSRLGNGRYFVFPFFELDKLSEIDIFNLNFPTDIIVSSTWAKEVLQNNGINKPINVIPLGVDTNIFNYSTDNAQNYDKYVFITIGKWEKRKSHDTIIECFNRAFDQNDNVELWMITHNSFLNKEEEQQWISLASTSKLSNKIKIFPRLPSHQDLANVLSYASCGIYISRGEGWNMELLETMAMNKPVIVSNYSAHTEYCNSQNSFMVDIDSTEPAIDNKWFFGNGNWAKIDEKQKEQTIEYMRFVVKNNIRTNANGLSTALKLSWTNTISHLIDILK